jgi:hypothetical protein
MESPEEFQGKHTINVSMLERMGAMNPDIVQFIEE